MKEKYFPVRLLLTGLILIILVWFTTRFCFSFLRSTDCLNIGSKDLVLTGDGTPGNPFLITDLDDFLLFRDSVNAGERFEGLYFLQTCDIDLGEDSIWIPIGIFGSGNYFYGIYDGGGHCIFNLRYISEESPSNGGLFGTLGGVVCNIGIESGFIEGDYIGSIASHSTGSSAAIINCYNRAEVKGRGRAGGICDNFSNGIIINCINYGEVSAPTAAQIVSYNARAILNVYPEEFAFSGNFQGTFSNYTMNVETTIYEMLNNGIEYINKQEIFEQGFLKYWSDQER